MDILEPADMPLYSSDDDADAADGLPNLPVLAKSLLPPTIDATGPTGIVTAELAAAAAAGCANAVRCHIKARSAHVKRSICSKPLQLWRSDLCSTDEC